MGHRKICVSFETTGVRLGISLFDAAAAKVTLLAELFEETGSKQSELLIPELEKLFKKVRAAKSDIACLAVDVGPGSFTGVRVGVAAARGIAQALRVPLIGVSSLEAMARAIAKQKDNQVLAVTIPALQGEVYFAGYEHSRGRWKVIQPPVWKRTEELEAFLARLCKKTDVTAAVENWRDDLMALKKRFSQVNWIETPVLPHPFFVGRAALEIFKKNPRPFDYEKVVPLYLQPSWAERKRDAVA